MRALTNSATKKPGQAIDEFDMRSVSKDVNVDVCTGCMGTRVNLNVFFSRKNYQHTPCTLCKEVDQ